MSFDPPVYLEDKAVEEWERLLPYMQSKGFDKEEYVMTYAVYCVAVQQYEDAIQEINANGYLISGRLESLVKNPAFTIMKEANERIAQGSRAFGFTPGDLKKLEATGEEDDLPEYAKDLF